jgi:hypothetical protein
MTVMRWAAVGAVTVALLVAAPAAIAAPTLTILAPAALDVHLSTTAGSGAATATIVVRNDDDAAAERVQFKAEGAHAADVQVTSDVTRIDAHATKTVPLTFASGNKDVSFSGVLVASANGAAAGAVSLTVDRAKPGDWWFWVLFEPLLAAIVVAVVGWWGSGKALSDPFANAKWDFDKSWASNFSIAGGILAAIVASGALPVGFTKSATFAGLSLLFAVLALLAPFVYGATRSGGHGFVWSFLLSSVFTLWAAFGQLTTAYLLFHDLRTTASLPGFVTALFLGIAIGAAILLGFYGVKSIRWTLAKPEQDERIAGDPEWALL